MLHPWLLDGGVILAYFITVISIGLYKGWADKTMEGFAVGNRSIPWWAVLASILAAEISAATFLGAPDEGYASRNYTYAQLAIGTVLARVVVAFVFIKPYYDLRVVSIYQFLRTRFGERTKNGASAIFLISRALASGTRLYVAAIVLVLGYEFISGVALAPLQQVGLYVASLVFVTAATAIYTALGGIKAVVWTDVIQAVVMFGSLAFALWSLLQAVPGGWEGAMSVLNAPDDMIFFDWGYRAECLILRKCSQGIGDGIHSLGGTLRLYVHHNGHTWHRSGHGAADVDGQKCRQESPSADSFRRGRHPYCALFSHNRHPALGIVSKGGDAPCIRILHLA